MMSLHAAERTAPAADEDPSAHAGDQRALIGERLRQQVPELFEGRLPSYLARRLDSSLYALGTHQGGGGVAAVEEAAAFVNGDEGITTDFDGSRASLIKRFELFGDIELEPFDAQETTRRMIARSLISGYYDNPDIGRFIFTFPVRPEALAEVGGIPRRAAGLPWYDLSETDPSKHASDVFQDDVKGIPLNPKYCAGFIDREGTFHPNADFMRADSFKPTSIETMKLAEAGIVKINVA